MDRGQFEDVRCSLVHKKRWFTGGKATWLCTFKFYFDRSWLWPIIRLIIWLKMQLTWYHVRSFLWSFATVNPPAESTLIEVKFKEIHIFYENLFRCLIVQFRSFIIYAMSKTQSAWPTARIFNISSTWLLALFVWYMLDGWDFRRGNH